MNSIFQKMRAWLAKLLKPAFRLGKSQENRFSETNGQPTCQDSKSPGGPKSISETETTVSAVTQEEPQLPVETHSGVTSGTLEKRSVDLCASQPDEKHSVTEVLEARDSLANGQKLQSETAKLVISGPDISNGCKEVTFPECEQKPELDESHAVPEHPIKNSEKLPEMSCFKTDHLEDPGNVPIKSNVVSEMATCEDFVAAKTALEEVRGHKGDSPAPVSKAVPHIQKLGEMPSIPEQKQDLAQETSESAVADEWEGFSERVQSAAPVEVGPPAERPVEVLKRGAAQGNEAPPETGEQPANDRQKKAYPPVDISEYDEPGTRPLPEPYCYWNRILTARFVRTAAQAQVHLATSPRLLAAALSDDVGKRVPPSEAEVQFVDAMRTAYRTLAMDSPARIRTFRRFSPTDGTPMCVAFLALSVLAAHRMHGDEISSGSAYYVRLAELLNIPLGSNSLPTDFRTDEFESLWGFLAKWISKKMQLTLALPGNSTQKKYIAYPLAHVPLRQLDLEKLPVVFSWAGYSSDTQVSPERMTDDLRRWDQSYASFSEAGRAALNDSRLSAVLAQVRSELRAWDGLTTDSQGQRRAQVEILLDSVMRRSRLFLLAPRKDGYPQVFASGSLELSGGESWYDPLELGPDDGELLLAGVSWQSEEDGKCILSRPAGKAFVLAPNSEYSGLVSRTEIPKDTLCAVLCHESLVQSVGSYLAGVCDTVPSPIQERGIPTGWRLFQKVRAVRLPEHLPAEFRSLNVASLADIIPQGGLRLGSRWTWMQGSPPRLLIEGHEGQLVYINDNVRELDDEGYVKTDQIFEVAGIYEVRVGSLVKKVQIVEPSLRPSPAGSEGKGTNHSKPLYEVILPPGEWTLVGRTPFNSSLVGIEGPRKRLTFCRFEPTFAVKVGAGPGAKVIQFVRKPVECHGKVRKEPDTQAWANAIYSASIRHPILECAIEDDQGHMVQDWTEYVWSAKRLKRQWRQAHQ